MNYSISINLLHLKSIIAEVSGKKCVIIPIEDNDLFVSQDEGAEKPKGVYVRLAAWETSGKYGDTHLVKQSFSLEKRRSMSEDEKKAQPILGNMRPIEQREVTDALPIPEPKKGEDLEINWDSFN